MILWPRFPSFETYIEDLTKSNKIDRAPNPMELLVELESHNLFKQETGSCIKKEGLINLYKEGKDR